MKRASPVNCFYAKQFVDAVNCCGGRQHLNGNAARREFLLKARGGPHTAVRAGSDHKPLQMPVQQRAEILQMQHVTLTPPPDRRALPVQDDCGRCGECLPMQPVMVTAQQQIDRRPARGRWHDGDDRWPGWAAAGTISPPQGRTPVDQVLGVGPPSAAWWSAHPGGVAAREQRRHKLSIASATDAGQGRSS